LLMPVFHYATLTTVCIFYRSAAYFTLIKYHIMWISIV